MTVTIEVKGDELMSDDGMSMVMNEWHHSPGGCVPLHLNLQLVLLTGGTPACKQHRFNQV